MCSIGPARRSTSKASSACSIRRVRVATPSRMRNGARRLPIHVVRFPSSWDVSSPSSACRKPSHGTGRCSNEPARCVCGPHKNPEFPSMSDALLIRLKFGSRTWNRWREEHPDVTVTLDGAKLDGMILTGINFSHASLRGASMHATNLMNADLRHADLTGANLAEADLIAANMEGAILRGATLREADLLGANLAGAQYAGDDLTGALHVPPAK